MPRAQTVKASSEDFRAQQHAISATAGEEVPELRHSDFHPSDLDVVGERDAQHAAAEAKFFEDKVEIIIEMDDSPDAPLFVMLGHNGVSQYVKRGEPQVVKRKFLYAAFAAKTLRYACAFGKDNSNTEFNRLSPSVSMQYRVQLLRDDNPQGGPRWLRSISANA